MKKVLVTGATGFIGTHLVSALVKNNYLVCILHRASSNLEAFLDFGPAVTYVSGDITNQESINSAVKDKDYVFHLAGLISSSRKDKNLMKKINVDGTKYIIDACLKHSVKKLIYVSSVVAVGASSNKEILNEESVYDDKLNSLSYFDTKKQAEELVLFAVHNQNLPAVILNPSTVYGEGDIKKESRKLQKLAAMGRLPFYTQGGVSVVDIKDVVNAIINSITLGKIGSRYILSGENIEIKNLLECISDISGTRAPFLKVPQFLFYILGFIGDILSYLKISFPFTLEKVKVASLYHWFDSHKAKKELGFTTGTAKDAIKKSILWSKKNNFI
ncbi:MAG: NAD-dependent epimerase/dehydratase family protein [Bdellovibrionales bacterium]|nr:NAD-dependent epimerase/dehydratase family protein [Bdellovibrionales bacterium]